MSPFRRARQSEAQSDVPVLRSLGPKYEKDLHGRHAEVLVRVLADTSANAAKNIALAGHYGSGKSSVMLGVQSGLDDRDINWVNLSLSSLGIDNTKRARITDDGALAPLTNLIQKEIVKQLLYRKPPGDMPGSRYFRIDSFRAGPAALWGIAMAVGFFVVAVLLGLVDRVEKVGPKDLATGPDWVPWAVVALLGLFLGGVWFLGLRSLQSRVRVESLSAGGAAVKLSAKENSYFDEYLDEIVYFFQKTKTQVAIFEDLDRFKDPHIFETLRELNTVLNNSEQIGSRPVRFVYAVRDSIFEQLSVDVPDSEGEVVPARASASETTPSANRTKFFDLVVPMVPFLTHRSARDLLTEEFATSQLQPSSALVTLVGSHLTDMRLIRNVRNEFEIYRVSVLGKSGLKGLTADKLFAMIVYKNLHLEDFEAVRLGTSQIDLAHKAFREMVQYQASYQSMLAKRALDQIDSNALWEKHAEAAGVILERVLKLMNRASRQGGHPVLRHGSQNYALSNLTSGDFWRSLYQTREDIVLGLPGYTGTTLSFEDVAALLGDRSVALDKSVKADGTSLERASRVASATKDFVARATMAELLARPELVMPTESGAERNLDEIVRALVSPLAFDLIAQGYIDENYTLYCSDYHAIAISVSAMNFILHCVQVDRADHRFRFDESSSIEAVETEMGARFLDGESVFNLEVFDHYLPTRPERLDEGLKKIIVRTATDTSFLDTYLVDGTAGDLLVGRMTPNCRGIFVHLIQKAPLDLRTAIALVDVAAQNAGRDVDYEASEHTAEFVSEHYAQMQAFVSTVDASSASDSAVLLGRLGAEISDLGVLGQRQRQAVVKAGLYRVTRTNLLAALGHGASLALDAVKATDEDVYKHVLANLDDYLGALEDDEVTVDSPNEFVGVLQEVLDAFESATLAVAEGASESCLVADLEDLEEAAWTTVVSAGRFAATVANVSLFVENLGVTGEMVTQLSTIDLSEAGEVEEVSRFDLAYVLADVEGLSIDTRVRLLRQLELSSFMDVEQLTDNGLSLLPVLLAAELVADVADTYTPVRGRPFAFREKYFAASKDLATYVCNLPLSGDDLTQMMRSRRVAPAVKKAIADDVDFVGGRLTRQGAIAIAEWAAMGNTVSVALLLELSRAGAPAERILVLLEPHLPEIETSELDAILLALGDEYEPLTRIGHHRPKLKERPGTEELLLELKRRDRVSSFGPALLGGVRVNMRH